VLATQVSSTNYQQELAAALLHQTSVAEDSSPYLAASVAVQARTTSWLHISGVQVRNTS
jgi:hypothetical protein